ncbi:MAG: thermonuclease family protein [Deltaproteobacteria bacterium]|nr:thermonuclease family protein [Deltaproteobacteria bacterium]
MALNFNFLIYLVFLISTSSVYSADLPEKWSGVVTRVKDGDTVVVGGHTCRLYGIDAPEIAHGKKPGQPYGEESKRALEGLILNKVVDIQTTGAKTYKRDVCRIFLDGTDVNIEMVRWGYAWAYVQYLKRPYASEYIDAERKALTGRLGLWQDSLPTPPWEFRHNKKR